MLLQCASSNRMKFRLPLSGRWRTSSSLSRPGKKPDALRDGASASRSSYVGVSAFTGPQESGTSRIRLPHTARYAHNGDGRVHIWPRAGKWNFFPVAEEPCILAAGNREWVTPPTAARGASSKLYYPRNSLARSGAGSCNSHRDGTRAPPRPLGLPCGEDAYNALLTSAATEAQPGR